MSLAALERGLGEEFDLRGAWRMVAAGAIGFGIAYRPFADHAAWSLALGLWCGYCIAFGAMGSVCRWCRVRGAFLLFGLVLCILVGAATGWLIERRLAQPMEGPAIEARVYLHLAYCAVLMSTPVGQAAWRYRALRHAEAERVRLLAELKLLQAQIEPHFLFNTLATLRSLVRQQSADALPLLDRVSGFLEAVLPEVRSGHSNLGRELNIIDQYLGIMALRMTPRLAYRIDVDSALHRLPLPALLLQPLVENAVVHGIEPCEAGGHILVEGRSTGEELQLRVFNTGMKLEAAFTRRPEGLALQNLRERLRALHGDAARFSLRSTAEGTEALLLLPMRGAEA